MHVRWAASRRLALQQGLTGEEVLQVALASYGESQSKAKRRLSVELAASSLTVRHAAAAAMHVASRAPACLTRTAAVSMQTAGVRPAAATGKGAHRANGSATMDELDQMLSSVRMRVRMVLVTGADCACARRGVAASLTLGRPRR